ncbi:MAG: sulfatase [Lentisphaeraceae bacterium]|nr:sulfatase [Lentisphaeraceae bacterium]
MKNITILFLLTAAFISGRAFGQSDKPLNFVFILADDLGRQDLSVEGSTFYESPNIDSIANTGMRFDNGYATCQVCSPSRASILLGKYPARTGITDWIGAKTGKKWNRNDIILPSENKSQLPHEDTSLPEALKEAGYKTFFAGKWHLGGKGSFPEDHGFDINIGGHHAGSPPGGYFGPYRNPKMKSLKDGESLPIRLGQETAKFIEEHKDQKFLAYLSFYSVHGPIQTTKEKWAKYQKKATKEKMAKSRFLIDRTLPVRQVQDNPIYAGMIESMDDAVGIVLDKLKELKLDKNTVVIFTSDNGGVSSGDAFATSNLPFRGGKGRQWEGGIREPYYIKVPGMASGKVSSVPVTGTDFYPTILELAGIKAKPEQHVDGVSLVPLLNGKSIAQRDLFWHYPHYGNQGGEPSSIIRSGKWKLIHYYEDGRNELYNLESDVVEKNNLIDQHSEIVSVLKKKLDEWLKDTEALIPEKDPRYNPEAAQKKKEMIRTKKLPNLEKQHANFLSPDFDPKNKWWGSYVDN